MHVALLMHSLMCSMCSLSSCMKHLTLSTLNFAMQAATFVPPKGHTIVCRISLAATERIKSSQQHHRRSKYVGPATRSIFFDAITNTGRKRRLSEMLF